MYEQLPRILPVPYQWPTMGGYIMLQMQTSIIRWWRLRCVVAPAMWATEPCIRTGRDGRLMEPGRKKAVGGEGNQGDR